MNQTVLVFQEESILAATGQGGEHPQLKQVSKVVLTGYGDSFDRWKEGLEKLKGQINLDQVRLVLPAAMCSTKMLLVPFAKGKQLREMVRRETEDSFRSSLMDFSVIRADKHVGMSLCCGSAEESVLARFGAMCRDMGIRIDGITVPLEGYLRFLSHETAYQNHTAIFLFFEEGGVTSVLGQEGQYRYSTRSRLFSEPGTLDFGTEIVRNISGILQFQAASKSEAPITDVYYAGCPDSDFEVSLEGIRSMGLSVHPMSFGESVTVPGGVPLMDWAQCIGAMTVGVRGRHDMNLPRTAKEETAEGEGSTPLWKHLLPVGIVLLVSGLAVGVVWGIDLGQRMKIADIEDWRESAAIQESYQEAVALKEESKRLERAIASVSAANESLATYPSLDSGIWERIKVAGGTMITVELRSYQADSGVLSFLATSEGVIDIPSYILQLKQTGLFYQVDYSGYAYGDGGYQLSLSCILDGNAPGGEEE